MSIASIGNTQAAAAGAAEGARTKLAGDFDAFLTMLTTQLKNQDPLSPMDSTQFTSQLVQFASVEQQINSNKNLEKLVALQNMNRTATALSYIGSTISAQTPLLPLQGGPATFNYVLNQDADKLTVGIFDKTGKMVRSIDNPARVAGSHEVTWDGKDGSGNTLPDGVYEVRVLGKDANGNAMGGMVATTGTVTGVTSEGEDVMLSMGDVLVSMDKVLGFRSAPRTTTAAAN